VAEGAPLLREYAGKTCIEGSNPSDSANTLHLTLTRRRARNQVPAVEQRLGRAPRAQSGRGRRAAWQIRTYKPVSVSVDTSVADVARLMPERRTHHVVVTRDGAMVGVVSAHCA
jgi:CBS domain-containing protein